MDKYRVARGNTQGAFQDWQEARNIAAATKKAAISRLHEHLIEFEQNATARGTVVHWAKDSDEARRSSSASSAAERPNASSRAR
jgi:L-lactate dehydrogenase complex protein LldF